MSHEAIRVTGTNGDLPTDIIEESVVRLVTAADQARSRRDAIKAEYDAASELCTRLDKAVKALTAPKAEHKDRSHAEHKKVKQAKSGPPDANFAPGQPRVALARQDVILQALKTLDHAAGSKEIGEASGLSRQTVTSGLAHLRHRGLIRYAGKKPGVGAGNLWAPFDTDTEAEATDTETEGAE